MAAPSTNGATDGSQSPGAPAKDPPRQSASGLLLPVPGAVARPASPDGSVASAAEPDADVTATCIALEAAADVEAANDAAAGDAAVLLPDDLLATVSLSPPPVELGNPLALSVRTLNDAMPTLTLRGPELPVVPATAPFPPPTAAIPPPPRRQSSSLPSLSSPAPAADSPPAPDRLVLSRLDDRTYLMRRYLDPHRNRLDRDIRPPPGYGPTLEPEHSAARARRMMRALGFY